MKETSIGGHDIDPAVQLEQRKAWEELQTVLESSFDKLSSFLYSDEPGQQHFWLEGDNPTAKHINVVRYVKPDVGYDYGIFWEYCVFAEPSEEVGETKESYYYFTADNSDFVKVVLDREKYGLSMYLNLDFDIDETMGDEAILDKLFDDETVAKARHMTDMVTMEVSLGFNGLPVNTKESQWLSSAVRQAKIMPLVD